MPGLSVTIDITNLDKVVTNLKTLEDKLLTGLTPAMESIGKLGSVYFAGIAFQSRGREFNKPWPSLAGPTVVDKTKHWPGRPDMVRTTSLRNNFTYSVGPGMVTLKNSSPYFLPHQLGTKSGEGRGHNIPQRVMIGVTPAFQTMVATAVKTQVDVLIKESMAV